MKRQRGRGRKPGGGNGGGGGGNQGNRSLESNGPEVKIRGTAAQIYEKYSQYARDAQSSGDRVKYENYLQHAEHYFRIMAATMPREQRIAQQNEQNGLNNGDDRDGDEQPTDAMKVVDEASAEEDGDSFDGDENESRDDDEVAASSEEREAVSGEGQGEGQGRGRRRRRGRRNPDGQTHDNNGNGGGDRPTGGDTEARSALDVLARKQAAVAGG
jgi:hypothetical protein